MNKYRFVTDKVRLSGREGENIFVEGYAITKDLDSYNTKFSDSCMKSIGEQLIKKDVKVSSQHHGSLTRIAKEKLARLKKEGGDAKLIAELESVLNGREYADAIPVEANFDSNGVYLKTKINKHLEKIDKKYFEALTGQLQDGFLNGMSIEFDKENALAHKEYDSKKGSYVTVFDDVPITGISFVSNASNPSARITSVAVRMATDLKDLKGDEKMSEEQEVKNEVKEQPAKQDKVENNDVTKEIPKEALEQIQKQLKEEILTNLKEEQEAKVKAEQEASLKEENETLKKQLEEAKKAQDLGQKPVGKGLVKPNENSGNNLDQVNADVEKIRKELDEMPIADVLKLYEEKGLGFKSRNY